MFVALLFMIQTVGAQDFESLPTAARCVLAARGTTGPVTKPLVREALADAKQIEIAVLMFESDCPEYVKVTRRGLTLEEAIKHPPTLQELVTQPGFCRAWGPDAYVTADLYRRYAHLTAEDFADLRECVTRR